MMYPCRMAFDPRGRAFLAAACLLFLCCFLALASPAQAGDAGELPWQSFESALAPEKLEKPALVFFQAPWCYFCRKMQRLVFTRPATSEMMAQDFVLVNVDVTKNEKLAGKLKVSRLPDTWFVDRDKKVILKIEGYIPPDKFERLLAYIAGGHYLKQSFEAFEESR